MGKTAFIFPGQGAQKAGMGKDFYEHSEIARNIIDRSSGLLKLDMKSLCFEGIILNICCRHAAVMPCVFPTDLRRLEH